MSSETSTESRRAGQDAGFQPWHFYLLLSMVGATVAVMLSRQTHPAALIVLSLAVVATGLVGVALHRALAGLVGGQTDLDEPVAESALEGLQREKALALRSIKELEFDHAMGKVSEKDFAEIGARLRARALALMEAIEAGERPEAGAKKTAAARTRACPNCKTRNDTDAKFCKQCGAKL